MLIELISANARYTPPLNECDCLIYYILYILQISNSLKIVYVQLLFQK